MMPEIRHNFNAALPQRNSDRTPQVARINDVGELQRFSTKPPSRSQLKRHRKQRRGQGHPERLVMLATPSGLILATASELGLTGGVR